MAVQIKDESPPLPALLRPPPSTKQVGSLRISKTAPLLLLTWATRIATPFVWSKNTLVAVVRRGVFDKKTFATLITISFCLGTIDGRQTQVPSSCEGGIYSLDFRRTGKLKTSARVDRHRPDLSSSCQDNKSSHSYSVEHGISKA
jgi:hypothetical protein